MIFNIYVDLYINLFDPYNNPIWGVAIIIPI